MSFMKKITQAIKTGRMPSVDSLAGELMNGGKSDSPFAKEEITDDMLTPMQLHVSRMNWDWREAAQSSNKGSGAAVRNWEQGADDIYLTWTPPQQAVQDYLLVMSWTGWAMALIQRDSRKFMPEYVDALMSDRLGTTRVTSVSAASAPDNAVCFPAGDKNGFYYLKLIAKTANGDYIEVKDYCIGSAKLRDEKQLGAAPEGAVSVDVPAGSREPNSEEQKYKPR